jgi:hypothetical protein
MLAILIILVVYAVLLVLTCLFFTGAKERPCMPVTSKNPNICKGYKCSCGNVVHCQEDTTECALCGIEICEKCCEENYSGICKECYRKV